MSWTQRARADVGVSGSSGATIYVAEAPAIVAATYSATSNVSCVVEDMNGILALKGITGAMLQQNASASLGSGLTTFAVAFPGSVHAGDTIVVALTCSPNAFGTCPITVTDTLGNTYTLIYNHILTGGLIQLGIFIATAGSSGANTVTATAPGGGGGLSTMFGSPAMAVLEYPGSATVDTLTVATSSTGGSVPVSVATSSNSEILLNIVGIGPTCASTPPSPQISGPTGGIPSAWLVIREPGGVYTDRSTYMFKGAGQQNSGNQEIRQRGTATVHLIVLAGDTYQPTRGTQLFWFDQTQASGFQMVFSGLIEDIENQYFSPAGDHYVILTCVSFESVLDTVYADTAVSYVNQTCGAIVADLFARFENGCPLTLGSVSAGVTLPRFNVSIGQKISDIFDQLATTSEFTWNVNPATLQIFFGAPSVNPAPFTLASSDILWDGTIQIKWSVDGRDKRNRQAVKLSYDAFPHSQENFTGAGLQSFTLRNPVQQVIKAWATPVTCNTATASFSGQPSAGDTVTIGPATGVWQANHLYGLGGIIIVGGYTYQVTVAGTSGASQPNFAAVTVTGGTVTDNTMIWTCEGPSGLAPAGNASTQTYTFVATLDNTQFGQVLIGANLAATVQNLVDAINAAAPYSGTPATKGRGLTFSLPTWENSQVNAITVTGTGFTAQQKAPGSGWVAGLSSTGTAFAWSSSVTSGGQSPFGTVDLQVYVQGTSTAAPGLAYTPGSATVTLATPLNSGSLLSVEYTRADGDVIQCENSTDVAATAAVTFGTGKYQQMTDQSSTGLIATSAAAGLQLAQQIIAGYTTPPQKIEFNTYRSGLMPGQQLTISLTSPTIAGSAPVINGNWVIETVSFALAPVVDDQTETAPWLLAPNYGHYRYTVICVNVEEIASWLDFWKGNTGGGSGGGALPGPAALSATSGGATPTANVVGPIGKYSTTFTSVTTATITHNLNTTSPIVQCYDGSGNQVIPQNIAVTSANVVTLTFGASFTGSVVVIG